LGRPGGVSRAVGRRVFGLFRSQWGARRGLGGGSRASSDAEGCLQMLGSETCRAKHRAAVLCAPSSYQQHLPNGTFFFTSQLVVGERAGQPTHERRRSSGTSLDRSLPRQDLSERRVTKAHGADALHSCRVRCVRAGSRHRRRHVKLAKAKSASCLQEAVLLIRPFNSSLCSLARVPWANHRWSCASCVGNSSTTRCIMLRINGDVTVEMNTVPRRKRT
jgi:hypothetical protein